MAGGVGGRPHAPQPVAVVDLDAGAADGVGQAQPPDVLARAVVQQGRQPADRVVDVPRRRAGDRLAGARAVAVVSQFA
jgi:hypothetical protein